jgi:hypothetical protein
MARILPPSVFRAEYVAPQLKKSVKQNLFDQWTSPEGVKTAVDLTDLVGGTIADGVTKFNRYQNRDPKAPTYNEALARVAGAKTHLQRQRAYQQMSEAYDRPGSGRLTRRLSGGPEETATTQYKRMLSPMRYPKGTGGDGRKPPRIKYDAVQNLLKAGGDPDTQLGQANLMLAIRNAIPEGSSGEPDPALLPQGLFTSDGQGMRFRPQDELKKIQNLPLNGAAYKSYIAQQQQTYQSLVNRANRLTPEQVRQLEGIASDGRTAYKTISTAFSAGTPESLGEVDRMLMDVNNPIARGLRSAMPSYGRPGSSGSMVNTGNRGGAGGGGVGAGSTPLSSAAAGGMSLAGGGTNQPVPPAPPAQLPPTAPPANPLEIFPPEEVPAEEEVAAAQSDAAAAAATAAALIGGMVQTRPAAQSVPPVAPVVPAAALSTPVPSSEAGMMSGAQTGIQNRLVEQATGERRDRGSFLSEPREESRSLPRPAPRPVRRRQRTQASSREQAAKKKKTSNTEKGQKVARAALAQQGIRRQMKKNKISRARWIQAVTQGISEGKSNTASVKAARKKLFGQ